MLLPVDFSQLFYIRQKVSAKCKVELSCVFFQNIDEYS